MQKETPLLRFAWYFFAGAALLCGIARLRLLAIPLERDEGCFAAIGQSLWHGAQLYTTVFDNKPPLLYGLYGVFTLLFGYNASGVHIGLMLCHIGTGIFLYFLTARYFDKRTALLSVGFFLVLALLPNVFGFAAHATQLLLLPAMAGLWLLSQTRPSLLRIALAGALLGAAFLIKQQAIGIAIGTFAFLFWPTTEQETGNWTTKIVRVICLGLGMLAPIAATLGWFALQGRFGDLLYWTVNEPRELIGLGDSSAGTVQRYILPYFHGLEPLLILALCGIVLSLLDKNLRGRALPFVLVFAATLATTTLGVAFLPHYFVVALPFVAVLCALGVVEIGRLLPAMGRWAAPAIAVFTLGFSVLSQADYFFQPDFRKIHREAYGLNPFPEMEEIGYSLRKMTNKPGDVLVLGSEPEALVAAGQPLRTGYPFTIDTRITAGQAYQKATTDFLKNSKPKFVVFVPAASSWFPGYQQTPFVLDLQAFIQKNYGLAGVALIDKQSSKILWNDEARKPPSDPSKIGVLIFRSKE